MGKELYANNPTTTLDGAIDDSETLLSVASSSGFPTASGGQFRIAVESEIILVTSVAADDWTVQRGADGTTPASHSDGAEVRHPITRDALLNLVRQSHGGTNVAVRREMNFVDTASVTWSFTDDPTNNKVDIQATSAGGGGAGIPGERSLVPPVIGDFSVDASAVAGATITQGTNHIYINAPAKNGDGVLIGYKTAPATPYSVIAKVRFNGFGLNFMSGGLMFRDGATGRMHRLVHQVNDRNILVDKYTNNTTFSAVTGAALACSTASPALWLKIRDDGTNFTWFVSTDGNNWIQYTGPTISRTNWTANPNQIGFAYNANTSTSGVASGMRIESWEVING